MHKLNSMPRKITVCHIHHSTALDGSERQMLSLVSNLDRNRFRPIVVCPPNGPLVTALQKSDVPVLPLPLRSYLDFGSLRSLLQIIRREQVDIIHAHHSPSDFLSFTAANFTTRPVCLRTKHSLRPDYLFFEHRLLRLIGRYFVEAFVSSHAHATIAVSLAVKDSLITNNHLTGRKIITIYNGIDPAPFSHFVSRQDARRALGLPERDQVVLNVGRLSWEKGHRYLLEAFEQLRSVFPRLCLLIVGDGPLNESLRQQALSIGISDAVHFLGGRTDVPLLMAAADVAVQPSLYEGFGLAVVEAMFAGKSVVCSDVGGLKEIVRDGITGLRIPACNVNSLVSALGQLLRNPNQAAIMGQAGRDDAFARFSLSRMVADTEAVYESLLILKD